MLTNDQARVPQTPPLRGTLLAPTNVSEKLLAARAFLATAVLRETMSSGVSPMKLGVFRLPRVQVQSGGTFSLTPSEQVLEAVTCVLNERDEATVAMLLTSSLTRDLSVSDPLLHLLINKLTTQAQQEGIIWSPLLCRLSQMGRGPQNKPEYQPRIWPPADASKWLEQARPWIEQTSTQDVIAAFRESQLDATAWIRLFAESLRPMTQELVRLLMTFPETIEILLARKDLSPSDWSLVLFTHLGVSLKNDQSSLSTDPDSCTAGNSSVLFQSSDSLAYGLERLIHRTIAECGGLPHALRNICIAPVELARGYTPATSAGQPDDLRLRLLAWDSNTTIEEITAWAPPFADASYSNRLANARLLMTHPSATSRHAVQIEQVLTDPPGSGYRQKQYYENETLEGKSFSAKRLASISLSSSQKIMPDIMRVLTSQVLTGVGVSNTTPDLQLIQRLIGHPSATIETWTQVALTSDAPQVRLALAQHPHARRVPEVRSILLRQRRTEVLEELMRDASEVEFLLLWKRLASVAPSRALDLLQLKALPFPVPRAGLGPILKTGKKDLILRATGLMKDLVETTPDFFSVTRAIALAETVEAHQENPLPSPVLGQPLRRGTRRL